MQKDGKRNLADNNDVEEYSPRKGDVYKSFIIVIILLSLNIATWFYWGFNALNIVTIFPIPILPILLFYLVSNYYKRTLKLTISTNGVRYSSILKKIDCSWKDFLKIEIVTHRQISNVTGRFLSSTIDYIIHTSKGNFTIKESSDWGWDYPTTREIYDKIVSKVPDTEIIQRDVEHTVSESGGKG
jgi:hypothetical protein